MDVLISPQFADWLESLRDRRAQVRIAARIVRLRGGNVGMARSLGSGLSEVKIDYGPGYRLYFTREGDRLIVLLCGGDKSSQERDIGRARRLLEEKGW